MHAFHVPLNWNIGAPYQIHLEYQNATQEL